MWILLIVSPYFPPVRRNLNPSIRQNPASFHNQSCNFRGAFLERDITWMVRITPTDWSVLFYKIP